MPTDTHSPVTGNRTPEQPEPKLLGTLVAVANSPYTEIEVLDSGYRPMRSADGGNLGRAEYHLKPGLYKVRFRARGCRNEQLVLIEALASITVEPRKRLALVTAVPAQDALTQRPEHAVAVAGAADIGHTFAELLVFVRDWDGRPLLRPPQVGVFRHDDEAGRTNLLGAPDTRATWARWFIKPPPGHYRLRIADANGHGAVEQALWVPARRQVQVFLAVRPTGPILIGPDAPREPPDAPRPPDTDALTIRIVPLGERYTGTEPDIDHTEQAMFALGAPGAVPGADWARALNGPDGEPGHGPDPFDLDRPMIGLCTAHLLHRHLSALGPAERGPLTKEPGAGGPAPGSDEDRWEPLTKVLRRFAEAFAAADRTHYPADLIPLGHPDSNPWGAAPVPFAPMLRESWRMLLEATATPAGIGLVPSHSLAARLAPRVRASGGVWLSWAPRTTAPEPSRLVADRKPTPAEARHYASTLRSDFIDDPAVAEELYRARDRSEVGRSLIAHLYPPAVSGDPAGAAGEQLRERPAPDLPALVRALWLPGQVVLDGLGELKTAFYARPRGYIRVPGAPGDSHSGALPMDFMTRALEVGHGPAPWSVPPVKPSAGDPPASDRPGVEEVGKLRKICRKLNDTCFRQGPRDGTRRPGAGTAPNELGNGPFPTLTRSERQAQHEFNEQFPAAVRTARAAVPGAAAILEQLAAHLPRAVRWALAGDRNGPEDRYALGRELMRRVHVLLGQLLNEPRAEPSGRPAAPAAPACPPVAAH